MDVKGWKALGNRLSQYKVAKIKPLEEPEDTSANDEDAEEVTETSSSQSPKKKLEEDLPEQSRREQLLNLFEENPNPVSLPSESKQLQQSPQKIKVEQASLFDSPNPSKENSNRNLSRQQSESQKPKEESEDEKGGDKGFTPGDTIEFDL